MRARRSMTSRPPLYAAIRAFLLAALSTTLPILAQQPTTSGQVPPASGVQSEILAQTTTAWDGTAYKAYPAGQPQLTIRKVTIPPNTAMQWHTHPLPNIGYVLSGELTVESKDGVKRHYTAGQTIAETVNVVHRGVTGQQAAVLIVFYPGTPGLPLSEAAP